MRLPTPKQLDLAHKAAAFLTASPDPFHAIANAVHKLKQLGYLELHPGQALAKQNLTAGGKYYYVIQQTTLVAFGIGGQVVQDNFGFQVIGGHSDSPNLKVKPKSKLTKSTTTLLGVECYGGGLWHTWFDRDLSISGKVLIQSPHSEIQQRLVNLQTPVARVSTLCIHLQSADERKAFAVNKQDHLSPIVATQSILEQEAGDQLNNKNGTNDNGSWAKHQEPLLLQALADKLEVQVEDIVDFELNLYDTQAASIGGLQQEFLNSARLDNLATVFTSLHALGEYTASDHFQSSTDISMVVVFDHEEVGSTSAQGAGSPVLKQAMERVSTALAGSDGNHCSTDVLAAICQKSFILSVDQAHAVHPNYANKHEGQHAPLLNQGVVIKTNSNQRYTTNGTTGFVVRQLGRMHQVPIQEFCVRNDCPCGSTIGPTIAAATGVRTVDLGMPQWSMHSCREVMGVVDLTHGVNLFMGFFKDFRTIDSQLNPKLT